MVRRKGLEPLTYWFVASHSIQLSYRRIALRYITTVGQILQVLFSENFKFFRNWFHAAEAKLHLHLQRQKLLLLHRFSQHTNAPFPAPEEHLQQT